ncbi:MAG: ATP-binding protein [Acidimicrobiales bacterium]
MVNSTQWTVPLRRDSLAATEADVTGFLSQHGIAGHAAYVTQLVVEEVVRNLIEHTPPYAHDETATVSITVTARSVTVVIEDDRPPFDPIDAPPLDVTAPLEERRAGGMGLHLVRRLTDQLTYERADDRNRLTAVVSRS